MKIINTFEGFVMNRSITLILLCLVISFIVTPVSAQSNSTKFSENLVEKTNSTLGSTNEIHRWPDIDLISPPISFENESKDSADLTADKNSTDDNETKLLTYAKEYLSKGEYFPDISVARITKNLWIDSYYYDFTNVLLAFIMSNPDEKYSRTFRVYLDGDVLYEKITNTKRLVDSKLFTLDDGLHEFIFEVRHGAYGKGWALETAYLETPEYCDMRTSGDLGRDELFPQQHIATIEKYVFIYDPSNNWDEKLHVAVESSDPYSRWLRIKIDGQLVYSRIIYQSWETTIDVSEYMSETNFYIVTVEIQHGGYRQWNLVYLGIERSEAKYVPITLQFILSFDWNPSSSYLDDFVLGLREFADHAWDAYEDQLIVTKIDIYKNGQMWDDANIRCHEANDFNPFANQTHSGIQGSLRGMQVFHLPKYWPHYFTTWTTWLSYLAITHEMSHAFFHLADEYVKDNIEIECRSYWEVASIMDLPWIPFPKTEFCVRSNHDPDGDTPQTWWWWGWSCWETITYFNPEMYEPFTVYDNIFDDVAANYVEIVIH
jgi:hypothetical protein